MVDHASSALDGWVIKHRAQTQGTAQAYVMDHEGERTRMRAQDGYWYKEYVMFLPEAPTKEVRLYFDEKASKAVKPQDVVDKFKKQKAKELKAALEKAYQ